MSEAASCRERLMERGFDCPEWGDVEDCNPVKILLDDPKGGPTGVAERCSTAHRGSNSAPMSCVSLSSTSRRCSVPRVVLSQGPLHLHPQVTRFEPQLFRVFLLRRLWCPLPLCVPLDPCGHHRAACPQFGTAGVLVRERSSTRVPRGRSTRFDKCTCAGHGRTSLREVTRTIVGSRW